ncbi:MAG TPA: TlpA disulfide reductase family protein [Miltoncostaeaceae bacterium]|nr:TlpA disulfide reductase family protein [Miltoncostaeaceae bacterium]
MPDALETRLTHAGARLPEPPREATDRARVAALAALPAPPRRSPWRRPLGIAAAFAGAAALAGLLVALIIATPGGDDAARPAALVPDPASLGPLAACATPPPDLAVPCVEGTEAVRKGQPALATAPWLYARTDGSPDPARHPSLVFPPGVTYAQAVDALVQTVTMTGRLPGGTALGPPLPAGAVLLRPADPAEGIAIDLGAPFGRSPSGAANQVTIVGGGSPAGGDGVLWGAGSHVLAPDLPACMVVATRDAIPPACGPDDRVGATDRARPLDLPVVPLRSAPVDLTLPRLDDRVPVSLSSLRGRIVVLSAFASWCAPCADQVTPFRALAARYATDPDVATVGIAVNDVPVDAARFLRDHRLGFGATLVDREGDAVATLDVPAVPETLVLDREGRIAFRLAGALLEPATVEREVEALR